MLAPRPQSGFSLIELMVSITIGLIVLGGVIAVFSNTVSGSSDNLRASRLNHDLRAYMDLMARDLMRAGYGGAAPGIDNDGNGTVDAADLVFNPFVSAENDVQTSNAAGEPADSCILFSYNLDADAESAATGPRVGCGTGCTPNAAAFEDDDTMERFGFQLLNGALRTRTGGDAWPTCTGGDWATLTDPSVAIDTLNFAIATTEYNHDSQAFANCAAAACDCNGGADTCQYMRVVTITLEGELADDVSVRQRIVRNVRLRNDRYVP